MNDLLIAYISFAHLLEFTLAYFLLDQLYLKTKINYALILLILLFGLYIGQNFSYLDTLILFIFFFFLSLKNSTKKNVAHSLLVVVIAYLLETLTSQLIRPLFFKSIESTQSNEQFFLFFLILITSFILIFIGAKSINKWVLPIISGSRKESTISYLLTLCLLAYQIYWLLDNYAKNTPFLRGFILVFYVILVTLILSIIQTFTKNEELTFQAQQRKLEYDMMRKYAEEIKKQYQNMRKFRHDYVNILSSIEYYLDQNKIEELRQFYHTSVKQTKTLFKTNMLRLDDLQKINSIEVRSILTAKLIAAQEKKIDVQVEVNETIPSDLSVDPVVLIRILGILLDNAIEELESLNEGELLVGIFIMNGDLMFIIQNTVRENMEPLYLLKKEGFSTKGDNRGFGLANLEELILLEQRLLLETTATNEVFIQKITIMKG